MKAASSCQISLIWTYSQNQLFDSGVDFHKGSLQISARWNPLFLQIFLKFCHIHSVEIGSNFVFCHYELLLFLNVELVPQKIAAENRRKNRYTIRNSVWDQGLPTLYSNLWAQISYQSWVYLTIYAFFSLKIPDQIHHCKHAKQVWLFYVRTLPATFFASTSAVAKYQFAWWVIKHMIQKRSRLWAKKRFTTVDSMSEHSVDITREI